MRRMLLALLAFLLLLPGYASADPGSADLNDVAGLASFLDQFVGREMAEHHVPGAAVSVVKDGQVLLSRGYGMADVATGRPVDADQTLFAVGSVTKLFTATAAMQQVERGALRLDADVNTYLSAFKVPEAFGQPVFLSHLLTHTAGFNQLNIGVGTRSSAEIMPVGQFLAQGLPPRTEPPGQFFAYSNHGMTLAGHLVELAAGKSLPDYVEQAIFAPLGMVHSTMQQPAPVALAPDVAIGYAYAAGEYLPQERLYFHTSPAAGVSASAGDMARFMIAHLENGQGILSPPTAAEMHRRQFGHHPQLPGSAYGFREYFRNGQRALWHSGTQQGFASALFLIPEHRTGLFVTMNRATALEQFRMELIDAFVDRYFPGAGVGRAPVGGSMDLARFAGTYWGVEKPQRTLDKLEVLMADGLTKVSATSEGTLRLSGVWGSDGGEYAQVEPLLFQRVDGQDFIAFREDEQGRISHLFAGVDVSRKAAWHESPAFQLGLGGVALLLFLSVAAAALVGRSRRGLALPWARPVAAAASLVGLGFMTAVGLIAGTKGALFFMFGLPPVMPPLMALPWLVALAAPALVLFAVLAWRRRAWNLAARLHYTALVVGTLAFLWFLRFWNMLALPWS